MADSFTVDVDASSVIAALDRLGDAAERYVREAARETARAIQTEARARLGRQTHGTGQTAQNIAIEETEKSVLVRVKAIHRADNLPIWLEFGTRHMTSRPFLFASARLEEGPHLRRVSSALEDAIAEAGLGE